MCFLQVLFVGNCKTGKDWTHKTGWECISPWPCGNKDAKKYLKCICIDGQEHRIPSKQDRWRTEKKHYEGETKEVATHWC